MEAKLRPELPISGAWSYEPKWDGFRVLAWSDEPRLDSRNKRSLLRFFPELAPALLALPSGTVVDGELLVVVGGTPDFDALQMRLHPAASRVAMLAEETPDNWSPSTCSQIAATTFAANR